MDLINYLLINYEIMRWRNKVPLPIRLK